MYRPPVLQGLSCSSFELALIPDAWGKGVCWALHNFSFGNRELWFNREVMDSRFSVNVPSCPSSVVALPDLPRAQSLSPLWCLQMEEGEVGEGSTCVWFQVWLKSLMRLTTGCFKHNQLQRLLREEDIWGLRFLFVWFVVLKWILCEATVNELPSICWAVLLFALSLLASYSFEYIQMRRETLPGCPPGQKASHTVPAECLLHHQLHWLLRSMFMPPKVACVAFVHSSFPAEAQRDVRLVHWY